MSIKVMLVDDSTIVRALISRTLSHQPDIKVVATAGDGQEAIDTAKIHKPDVIVGYRDASYGRANGHATST